MPFVRWTAEAFSEKEGVSLNQFINQRQDLAIRTLHLDLPSVHTSLVGPRDHARATQLEEAETRISDTGRFFGVEYQLVEECLQAAVLSRNLERPRVETDGRFLRATRIADKVGVPNQRLRVLYHHAWTTYWWFEDYPEFVKLLDSVQDLGLKSTSADDIELVSNLWQLLFASCNAGKLDPLSVDLDGRRQKIESALIPLGEEGERPNNALWARTQLAFFHLLRVERDTEELRQLIAKFKSLISASEGLISYPVEPLAAIIQELGELFTDSPDYDGLLELVVTLTRKRVGRQQSGRMLLARGFQKFRASEVYDAILLFGRAQQELAIRETRDELTEALFAGSVAYEAAGLLWASRANALAALDQSLISFHEDGDLPGRALSVARRLVWLELRLGRVPHILQWFELCRILAGSLKSDANSLKRFEEDVRSQDHALALLFLRGNLEDLRLLQYLPDVLDRLGLPLSRMALLYALGYENLLREEGTVPEEESQQQLQQLMIDFARLPGGEHFAKRPTALDVRFQ